MLSNHEIIEEIGSERIIIEPFNVRNLGTNSYDVTLGEFYFREQRPEEGPVEIYNIYDENEVRRVWGYPKEARPIGVKAVNIRPDDHFIILQPGETVLAHTREFIGGRDNITTMMKARSSLGRNFIEVCKCAGMGDVGYVNRWTMEITNNSRYYCIPLRVGMRLAQLTFFRVGKAFDYSIAGKYQTSADLAEVMRMWKPDDMLPRLYRDWELREPEKRVRL